MRTHSIIHARCHSTGAILFAFAAFTGLLANLAVAFSQDRGRAHGGTTASTSENPVGEAAQLPEGVALMCGAETNAFTADSSNPLTDSEKTAGWKLLFDGKTTDGWRTYKRNDVAPGWKVVDGTLTCADPKNAGDLVTTDNFDWFELSLEYNISVGGNSGVMFHVVDGPALTWQSGPEIQLLDNKAEGGQESQLAGWLYQLYKPDIDPKTGKPIDATKPAGQWNELRVLVTPEKCETYMNGVKYYQFVLGSQDFNDHVAKSKFASMAKFAKSDSGYIALQGDHGQVAFRNIKIRPIAAKQ